uniref:Tudor domain-containing protein n=1 Tax=Ditylenchus dipsaci TaxID=166011 RepID=A0A915DSQ0_9BILA
MSFACSKSVQKDFTATKDLRPSPLPFLQQKGDRFMLNQGVHVSGCRLPRYESVRTPLLARICIEKKIFAATMACDPSKPWKVGDKCMALFVGDGQYYPAKITRSVDAFTFQVQFSDYNNFACVKESGLLRESDVVPMSRCDAKFENDNTKGMLMWASWRMWLIRLLWRACIEIDSLPHKDTSPEIAKLAQSGGSQDCKDNDIVDDSTADPSEDHERLMSSLTADVEASGIGATEKVGSKESKQVKHSDEGDGPDHVNKPKRDDFEHLPSDSALDIPAAPVMPNEEGKDENVLFDQLLRSYYNAGYYAGYHKGFKHGKQKSSSA